MSDRKPYVTLTDGNFPQEVLKSDQPVLVDFYADWCGPCRVIAPTIEQLAEEYRGKVKVAKLNVDDSPAAAARFGIRSIPTLLFFNRGEVVDRAMGAVPKAVLDDKLKALAPAA